MKTLAMRLSRRFTFPLITLIAFCLTTQTSKAQLQFNYGAKAGVNFSTLPGEGVGGYNALVGPHAGVIFRLSDPLEDGGFLTYIIHSELFYSMQDATFTGGHIVFSYLNLPIMIQRYILSSGFFIETGPQIGLLLAARSKDNGITPILKAVPKKSTLCSMSAWAMPFGQELASMPGTDWE